MTAFKRVALLTLLTFFGSQWAAAQETPVKISGDVRYRHEHKEPSTLEEGAESELRHRVRGRLKAVGQVNEKAIAGVRIVTGGEDAARSTNQTLGEESTYHEVAFDQIFFAWKYTDDLILAGGKIENPFYTAGGNQLIWDGDVTLGGLALVYKAKPEDDGLFARLGAFYHRANSGDKDQGLFSWQLGYALGIGEGNLKVGASQYHHDLLSGYPVMTDAFGNSVTTTTDADGNDISLYEVSYNTYELFLEYNQLLAGMPFSVFSSIAYNSHTEDDNQAYLAGFAIESSDESPYSFRYSYRDIQADAVVGAFTESDFADGQTNSKGSTVSVAYRVAENTSLAGHYYNFETEVDSDSPVAGDAYQIDFAVKF